MTCRLRDFERRGRTLRGTAAATKYLLFLIERMLLRACCFMIPRLASRASAISPAANFEPPEAPAIEHMAPLILSPRKGRRDVDFDDISPTPPLSAFLGHTYHGFRQRRTTFQAAFDDDAAARRHAYGF